MQAVKDYFGKGQKAAQGYSSYRQYTLDPNINTKDQITKEDLDNKVKQIFEWAKSKGALYYTFFAYPQTEGIIEKQQTFLDLDYFFGHTLQNTGAMKFSVKTLEKGESDGSSFPSGGLRTTPNARAYTIWDIKSEVFVRKSNKVLYIPSLLVSHNGQALDDKTFYRRAQKVLETNVVQLLGKLGVQTQSTALALGVQQQFFVIKKQAYQKRLDLRNTGRTLIGVHPPKHQQFCDHYYGKLPKIIEDALAQAEAELLQIGVPVKTRHKQVAPNQFEFAPLFDQAGKTIDHNMIMMQIFKQKFEKYGLTCLFHEKPFAKMNGSGKHCNWSLNYIGQNGELVNLFQFPKSDDEKAQKIFKIFIFVQLKALINYSKLYLASVACCGNEYRLGGHEAPPRILSAFLGQAVTSLISGQNLKQRKNLKQQIPNLNFDLHQENTDRNRTSPYAFTGNKFQFRAVGSAQNVSFPMAVIAATMAKQAKQVTKRLEKGTELDALLEQLRKQTEIMIFDEDGYSEEWVQQAKKRGLYINDKFYENFDNVFSNGKVFIQLGICKEQQLKAKAENMKQLYRNIVGTELHCLTRIINCEIIPRCYQFLKTLDNNSQSKIIKERTDKFVKSFEQLLTTENDLYKKSYNAASLQELGQIREIIEKARDVVDRVLEFIPKKDTWPEFEDFINDY